MKALLITLTTALLLSCEAKKKWDYKIELNRSGTVTVQDKHGNKSEITLEELEEFIELDNL